LGRLALGTKLILCSIPLRGGKPLGTSLGNISSNSFKIVLTLLGRDSSSLLVVVSASLHEIRKSVVIVEELLFYFQFLKIFGEQQY